MTLQFITHCGTTWMVGINGQCTDNRGNGGTLNGDPYVAFGNDELAAAPKCPKTMSCHTCGKKVRVETSKPSHSTKVTPL
jgi:hypothetical protein